MPDIETSVNLVLEEVHRPLSAVEMTDELRNHGWLPEHWTVLEVAEYLHQVHLEE